MIEITIIREQNAICELSCHGHAQFDDKGKDLVCAGVSTVLFGLLNALDMVDKACSLTVENNCIKIINHTNNAVVKDYLDCAYVQLQTLKNSYPAYIRMNERRSHEV